MKVYISVTIRYNVGPVIDRTSDHYHQPDEIGLLENTAIRWGREGHIIAVFPSLFFLHSVF